LGTEEKRGTTFRSSTDEIFDTLTGITKLDKETNQCIRGKNGSTEQCEGNKIPKPVATTRAENRHRQNTKTSTAMQTERKKEHRATEEEMEAPTSSGVPRNRLTRLNLHEHDDDDDKI
jgi:hypothetical protein